MGGRGGVDDPWESFRFEGRREEERKEKGGEVVVADDVASELSNREGRNKIRKGEGGGGGRGTSATFLQIDSMLRQGLSRWNHDSSVVEEDIQMVDPFDDRKKRGRREVSERAMEEEVGGTNFDASSSAPVRTEAKSSRSTTMNSTFPPVPLS